MSVVLKADNRALLQTAKFSYLTTSFASAVSTLTVLNGSFFSVNDYVLIGNFGSSSSELLKVRTVVGNDITFKDEADSTISTSFAHPESTRVTIVPYNQVRFYWTATATFSTGTLLTTANISPSQFFTQYTDTGNTTGYGWFVFLNQHTSVLSSNSNSIPYGGFSSATVKKTLDNFFSLMNDKELKTITYDMAFDWLNEGFNNARNALNLVNTEYNASDEVAINVLPNTTEYSLATDFSKLLYVRPSNNSSVQLSPIDLVNIPSYSYSGNSQTRYYLRNGYIGFVPTPTSAATYYMRYVKRITDLTSYDDIIDLPDGGYYAVKDWMLYRAYQKTNNPNAVSYMNAFNNWVATIKNVSITRDQAPSSWGIAPSANA